MMSDTSSSSTSSSTTDSVSSNNKMSYFPAHKNSPVFKSDVAAKLVGYACRRAKRSNIGSFDPIMKNTNTIKHSELILDDVIGQGSFSSVYSVKAVVNKKSSPVSNNENNESSSDSFSSSCSSSITSKLDTSKIVVKVLRQKTMDEPRMFAACAGDLFKEALMLSLLSHKNVVGAQAFGAGGIDAYKNGHHDAFFIVLERLQETLTDRIKKWSKTTKSMVGLFSSSSSKSSKKIEMLQAKSSTIIQLAEAIKYIHSEGMIHRDLKPDNIGFDSDGTLKVFDFDVARVLPTEEHPSKVHPDETFKLTRRTGSPRYMSPECALGQNYNAKTDVYSFGLLVHEIMTLKKPYIEIPAECHDEEVFVLGERPQIPDSFTPPMSQIINRCWSPKVAARPTMVEAYEVVSEELPKYVLQKTSKKKGLLFGGMGVRKSSSTNNNKTVLLSQ